jgi:hypothetical protein
MRPVALFVSLAVGLAVVPAAAQGTRRPTRPGDSRRMRAPRAERLSPIERMRRAGREAIASVPFPVFLPPVMPAGYDFGGLNVGPFGPNGEMALLFGFTPGPPDNAFTLLEYAASGPATSGEKQTETVKGPDDRDYFRVNWTAGGTSLRLTGPVAIKDVLLKVADGLSPFTGDENAKPTSWVPEERLPVRSLADAQRRVSFGLWVPDPATMPPAFVRAARGADRRNISARVYVHPFRQGNRTTNAVSYVLEGQRAPGAAREQFVIYQFATADRLQEWPDSGREFSLRSQRGNLAGRIYTTPVGGNRMSQTLVFTRAATTVVISRVYPPSPDVTALDEWFGTFALSLKPLPREAMPENAIKVRVPGLPESSPAQPSSGRTPESKPAEVKPGE